MFEVVLQCSGTHTEPGIADLAMGIKGAETERGPTSLFYLATHFTRRGERVPNPDLYVP